MTLPAPLLQESCDFVLIKTVPALGHLEVLLDHLLAVSETEDSVKWACSVLYSVDSRMACTSSFGLYKPSHAASCAGCYAFTNFAALGS